MIRTKTKKLHDEMERRNLSLLKFAKFLGISRMSLHWVLNGGSPGPELRRKMLAALEWTFDDLFVITNRRKTR